MTSDNLLFSRKPNVALESIDYQNDKFGEKLEALLSPLYLEISERKITKPANVASHPKIKEIEQAVFDRLGLKIKLVTDEELAAILPFYSNKNHIFLNKFWRGDFEIKDQEKLLKASMFKEGSVDLERAKLGGLFSEYENEVHLNLIELITNVKLTIPEIVGVFLHELGHGFSICEYSDRLESMNIALANAASAILHKNKDRTYVYRELKEANPKLKDSEIESLFSENRVIAGAKWFELVVSTVRSQLGNDKYDETSFEYMADNFAARFNYGKHTVIALDKISRVYGSPEKDKDVMRAAKFIAILNMLIWTIFLVAMLCISLPIGLIFSCFIFVVLLASGEGCKDYTYDDLQFRYKRIRADLVEQIKNPRLAPEKAKMFLEDIYIIDSSIKETYHFTSLFEGISNVLFKFNRDAKASVQAQQLLEDLIANDIYVASAKLKLA